MKHTGVIYTPEYIVRFILEKLEPSFSSFKSINILEPSCGDGVFIPLIHQSFSASNITVDAVEIDKTTCEGLKKHIDNKFITNLINTDFITYKSESKYDLIIGNPPYINRKHLKNEQSDSLDTFALNFSFLENRKIRNIWAAFILKSEGLLTEKGVLAFLLPAEILQVTHAKYIQDFLKNSFERVDVLYFKKMIFEDAEQDAVLLIAKKYVEITEKPGLFISELTTKNNQVISKRAKKFKPVLPNKWTSHTLTNYESSMLSRFLKDFNKLEKYATSSAGIVTAANNFFIVSRETVKKYDLGNYTKPIIKNGAYINGSIALTSSDWNALYDKNAPCYLLDFSGKKIHENAQKYLDIGIEQEIENRYKCRQRKRWYEVPSVWHSEGLFFKRSHFYPKLIHNENSILATDSAYRVSMLNGYDMKSLIFSFYNSMTLSFAEILGRSYAGGVLELTPNEFRSSPIPYTDINNVDFDLFKSNFSSKSNISDILNLNDNVILKNKYDLSQKDIVTLTNIRKKLIKNRLKKN